MRATDTVAPTLELERKPADGTCPSCGTETLARYPIHSEGGWYDVVKCQDCLVSVSRTRMARLGPIVLLSDSL